MLLAAIFVMGGAVGAFAATHLADEPVADPVPAADPVAAADPAPGAEEAPPLDPAADPVVALVGGEEIRASEIVLFFQTLNAELQQIPIVALWDQLLTGAIDRKLAAQRGRAQGMFDDPEIIEKGRIFLDQLVEDALLREAVAEAITDEAMALEYAKIIEESAAIEEVRVSHILVETQEEAFDIIGLIQEGADFAQMARERSLGPSNVDGGDLNYLTSGETIPDFEVAAFALGVGQMTPEPVQSEFGWHIILVTDRRPGAAPPLEEVADYMEDQISRRALDAFYADLMDGVVIERFNMDGTPIVEVEELPASEAVPTPAARPAP
jgi:peptidyl-prolyl cis-trans isomerase C